MLWKWLPWKFFASRLARWHGFLDPVGLLTRIESFAQPSEVGAPIELLRAGSVLHARGLINTKVIQQNIDWIWPYWVQRQFDPADASFIPRAFSITHINLTPRNWTAVGIPGCQALPIVDPRGLLTPLFDGWSLDGWVIPDQGPALLPSRLGPEQVSQKLDMTEGWAVDTVCRRDQLRLRSRIDARRADRFVNARAALEATSPVDGWLVLSVRPFNPEGVSFIHDLQRSDARTIAVENKPCLRFSREIDHWQTSCYEQGDVFFLVERGARTEDRDSVHCAKGLASGAAMFRLEAGQRTEVSVEVDLGCDKASRPLLPTGRAESWSQALEGTCRFDCPDRRFVELYDAALGTLVLLNPQDPVPGPYTYKRFWFRDAAYLLYAMICAGMTDRVSESLQRFPDRQTATGFFHSQQGEWDSNGQVLWLLGQYRQLTGRPLSEPWPKVVRKASRWIRRKRTSDDLEDLHAGLLPAGFSAEHLGNNDFYYWDDFWSVGGLRAAAGLMAGWDKPDDARGCQAGADALDRAIRRSLDRSKPNRRIEAIPASPYRRMDAGAVGSLAAGWPLAVRAPQDPELLGTADWLYQNCLVDGAFFQQMIHSGLNAYLTLHLAQVFLRAGREAYWPLVQAVAELASPTGQWPEAIHPGTGGGCMGDGQHGWAAAEWLLMVRSLFLREQAERLVLAPGIPRHWVRGGGSARLGPTPTRFGPVRVAVERAGDGLEVSWTARWRDRPEAIEIAPPGSEPRRVDPAEQGRAICATANRETRTERHTR